MSRSLSTHGWEDFKPRDDEDGNPAGRQLMSYDEEIRLGARRRTTRDHFDWVFLALRMRSTLWTRVCLDEQGTIVAQGFGPTRLEATKQMGRSLKARGIAAYRSLDSNEDDWR